jgi:5'-methylthioinosine phosphorylase
MSELAIIGGTGLSTLEGLSIHERRSIHTPFGSASNEVIIGELAGKEVLFLPRHGSDHRIPPHKINYRANMWALHSLGVKNIIAVAAVGGIRSDLAPGVIAIPDQIIDYTYGREHSVFSEDFVADNHIDFSYPYTEDLRQRLLATGYLTGQHIVDGGTYGATQGPRLETAAEIKRLAQDGCAMVGMTGMPEAALARELNMNYACCALMVNWAAGLSDNLITMADIERTLDDGMVQVKRLLTAFIVS